MATKSIKIKDQGRRLSSDEIDRFLSTAECLGSCEFKDLTITLFANASQPTAVLYRVTGYDHKLDILHEYPKEVQQVGRELLIPIEDLYNTFMTEVLGRHNGTGPTVH